MVVNDHAISTGRKRRRHPSVRISDNARFIAFKLSKKGYCGGDPLKILSCPVDIVMGMLEYDTFEDDYENAYIELNKEREDK